MQSWVPFVPDSASTFSWKVDAVYFYLSGVTLFFTLLISAILIFFVLRYRRRTPYEIPRPVAGVAQARDTVVGDSLHHCHDDLRMVCQGLF
jgi:heme/copper-type cytochrome/quinol oxidase subunit 2